MTTNDSLLAATAGRKFHTVLADPPWQFDNRTGKVAPEHRRLMRYPTMRLEEIMALPVAELGRRAGPPLSLDAERHPARGDRRHGGMGLHLQDEPALV